MFVISNSKSFIPQILKAVCPLGIKLIYYSPLGFVIQKNYDSETSEFNLNSFSAFQRYLTDKNPAHGRGAASFFFNLVRVVFERTSGRLKMQYLVPLWRFTPN